MNARPGALLRLAASGGRSDRLRIALTAVGAAASTILLLSAAAVAFIRTSSGDGPYRLDVLDQSGLRPGVIIALVLLCVPLAVFMGLCTRVGAPARDRRLATFRMAGATPSDATRIAALETGLAALIGAAIGLVGFVVGRALLDGADVDGRRLLPTDVRLPVVAVAAAVPLVVAGSVAASGFALRKVRIGPFGVTRRLPTRPPTALAALLFVVGSGGLVVTGLVIRGRAVSIVAIVLISMALFLLCVVGLLMGTASLAAATGRFLAERTSRADVLIASRRMIAAPYTSSRATASVLLAVLIGGAVLGTRANFLASQDPADTFYADTFDLINMVLVVAVVLSAANLLITTSESIVERRRTLASLVAGGTPRIVLARAALMETLLPLVPAVVLAAFAGVFASRSFFGTSVERLATFEVDGGNEMITVGIPIPWGGLLALGGGAIVVSVLVTAVSLTLLSRSTRPSEFRAAA